MALRSHIGYTTVAIGAGPASAGPSLIGYTLASIGGGNPGTAGPSLIGYATVTIAATGPGTARPSLIGYVTVAITTTTSYLWDGTTLRPAELHWWDGSTLHATT